MATKPKPGVADNVASLLDTSALTGGGAAEGSKDYGLGAAASDTFDASGIFGGKAKGSDLLNSFIHAGNGGDPGTAAAIQQALYMAGHFYPDNYVPDFGRVSTQDAQALAKALSLLSHNNKAAVAAKAEPTTLGTFLSQTAALGATNGSAAVQNLKDVANIRVPNAADISNVAEKVFQKVTGEKPDPRELAAFVATYQNQYVATEQANAQAVYQAKLGAAQQDASQSNVTLPISAPIQQQGPPSRPGQPGFHDPGGYQNGDSATAAEFAQNGPDVGAPSPLTFQEQMMSLGDAVKAAQGGGGPQTGLDTIIRQAPPDVSAAAENFARNKHPGEAAANDIADTFNTFLSLVTGKLA